eukprot:4380636-Pyramimonas_sp.AAC.1
MGLQHQELDHPAAARRYRDPRSSDGCCTPSDPRGVDARDRAPVEVDPEAVLSERLVQLLGLALADECLGRRGVHER